MTHFWRFGLANNGSKIRLVKNDVLEPRVFANRIAKKAKFRVDFPNKTTICRFRRVICDTKWSLEFPVRKIT